MNQPPKSVPFDPRGITSPDPSLLKYYVLVSLFSGPAFPFVLIPLLCKFYTLQYRFDDSGVAMTWGVLFRRETYLTFRRIQDIHLTRNIVQRWMNLATVSIQTASGSSTAEMSIEGILEADALRDFLYTQMRGAKRDVGSVVSATDGQSQPDEALVLLREVRDALRSVAVRGGQS